LSADQEVNRNPLPVQQCEKDEPNDGENQFITMDIFFATDPDFLSALS
jgi:hypothetical protein